MSRIGRKPGLFFIVACFSKLTTIAHAGLSDKHLILVCRGCLGGDGRGLPGRRLGWFGRGAGWAVWSGGRWGWFGRGAGGVVVLFPQDPGHRLRLRVDVQLVINIADMRADSTDADTVFVSYPLVTKPIDQ